MTKDELLEQLKKYCEGKSNTEKVEISVLNLNRIIKALEQDQCEDCIRRSDISLTDFEIIMCNGDYREGLKILLEKIAAAPSVTPKPKMGAWEWLSYEGIDEGNWHCSECRTIIPHMPEETDNTPIYKWCPFCGCKMQEETEAKKNAD